MSLNRILGFCHKANPLSVLALLFVPCIAMAQEVNVDTPNLSFENSDLSGWQQYIGRYSYDSSTDEYDYSNWQEQVNTTAIQVQRGNSSSQDPVISCWNLYTNPDGISSVRVGSTGAAEGSRRAYAQAEKLVYKFTVTENTTLFTYRFAAVLHCPDLVATNQQQREHTGKQLPSFSFKIDIVDPETGLQATPRCSEVTVNGDSESSYKLELVKDQANTTCNGSADRGNIGQYAFTRWTYGNIDLSKHIGKEATITILNHDCLSEQTNTNGTSTINGGSHRCYGYFWAETRKLELKVKNCGLEDAEIVAPEGFDQYTWYRSDGEAVEVDPSDKRKAIIRQNQISGTATYYCKLSNKDMDCTEVTLETKLKTVGVDIDFETEDGCDGLVSFSSEINSQGDNIIGYKWDFGDGTSSYEKTPEAHYMDPGEYKVTVSVTTEMGCSKTYTKPIEVRYFPKLEISTFDSICAGESVTLTALNATPRSTYLWSTGETTKEITVNEMMSSQKFTVEVTDEYACKYEKSYFINVKPMARFELVGGNEVCLRDTVTLTAVPDNLTSENVFFVWNTNDTTDVFKGCPLYDNTVYTVTAVLRNGCSTTKSKTIRVNPLPEVSLSGTNEVCLGDEAVITATASKGTGEITYVWNDLFNGNERYEHPDTTTTYTVRAVDQNLCNSSPKSHKVKVKSIPVLELKGDTAICDGKTTKLTMTGASASSIKWYDGTTGVNSIIRSPSQDTVYWAEGESNGCKSRAEITVRVLETPSIYADGETGVCPGGTVVLTAHGADHYKWGNGETGESLSFQPSVSTNYMLYGYSKQECEVSLQIPVTVYSNPMVYTQGDHQACLGAAVKVEAFDGNQGKTTFMWDNGSSGPSIIPQVNEEMNIRVIAINEYGCTDTAYHEILLTTPPTLSYLGETTVCLGEATTLQAAGAAVYTWNDGQTEVTGPSFTFKPTTNMKIRLTGSNVANCPSSIDILVGVNPQPVLYLSGDSAVCLNDEFTLNVTGAETYKWNTGDETSSITYKLGSTAEYTVYGYDQNGCSAKVSRFVEVRPSPFISVRKGEQSGCPGLPDTINLYASGAKIYEWSAEPANESVDGNGFTDHLRAQITEPTHFVVEGSDEYGCKSTAQIDVELLKRQELSFEVYPTFIESSNSNVRFTGVSPKECTWYWETDDNRNTIKGMNASHNFDATAADSFVVSVKAVDKYGCEYKGSQAVYTWIDFWAPDGFTPNGDDVNDAFKFYGGEYMDEFDFIIFNRLGEILYEGHSITDEWDGTFNGELCPWGVYGWYCKYKSNYMGINKDGERKGFVSLIR